MATKKNAKNGRKFKVGDRVIVPFGYHRPFGTIIEDRGNLAADKWFFNVKVEFSGDTGLARTLGNLGRLAPWSMSSYTGLRGVACDDSWRTNDGKV